MDNGCKYCSGEISILDTMEKLSTKRDVYPGIDVCIDEDALNITCIADVYEPNYTGGKVKIHYCPMCGRKLDD